MKDKRITIIV